MDGRMEGQIDGWWFFRKITPMRINEIGKVFPEGLSARFLKMLSKMQLFCGRFFRKVSRKVFPEDSAEGSAEGFVEGCLEGIAESSAPPALLQKVSGRFLEGFRKALGLRPWNGLPEKNLEGFAEILSGRFSRRLSGRFCGRFFRKVRRKVFPEGSKAAY